MTNLVALIPARANSKRIPGKNTRELAGHPLIAYTIAAARQSGVFSQIVVASDAEEILQLAQGIAQDLDATITPFLRNPSADDEPDIQWVSRVLYGIGQDWDALAILRPTSPFRAWYTINRAWTDLRCFRGYDSLRAVQPAREHPAKQWTIHVRSLAPLLLQPSGTPWHSQPTQSLPKVYVQNASLEIVWTESVRRTGTIAGDRILAFETQGWEGFDINTEQDWWVAERAIAEGVAQLPDM